MKTITYIPRKDDKDVQVSNGCLLSNVTETSLATFSVSNDGEFSVIDTNLQIRAGKGSTMKITISENELVNINIECTVIKNKRDVIKKPEIYVTKGNGTTRTSVKCTESETKTLGIFNIKEYTLTFPIKSPKETVAVIHFGNDLNIIKRITITTV